MKLAAITFTASLFAACGGETSRTDCEDGKCDTPGGTVEQQCTNSRVNAMDAARPHFTAPGVRWSCRDVNGVTANGNTKDDRGQEYCEYFAMLHTDGIPAVINDASGNPAFCDGVTATCATGVCNMETNTCVTAASVDTSHAADLLGKNVAGKAVTPLDPVLKKDQLDWLALNPDQKVGECVFTSWHKDINMSVSSSETLGGYRLDAQTPNTSNKLFQMQVGFNSNGAAKQLVNDCFTGGGGDASIKDGFMRGCTFCGGASCVPWRKSDPSVCTMAMRVAECGCKVQLNDGSNRQLDLAQQSDLDLAQELFVPVERRGFALGTWDGIGQLPTGCRFVRTGAPTHYAVAGAMVDDPNADQNIVACDLKASHITAATAKDPKEACRLTYGDDVVVHVRAPTPQMATITCDTTKPKCAGAPWDFANL